MLIVSAVFILSCNGSDTTTTTTTTSDVIPTEDDPAEDNYYEKISCTNHTSYSDRQIYFDGHTSFLTVRLPQIWEVTDVNGSYLISCEDRNIGVLYKGSQADLSVWKTVYTKEYTYDSLKVYRHVDKTGKGDTLQFRHRLCFEYDGDTRESFTLEIFYNEISVFNIANIINRILIRPIVSDPRLGCLGISDPDNILIIGNSFINSSSIYSILTEMLSDNWKNCSVDAYSRGYATVKTYAEDEYLMGRIRDKEYDAVFVCGFYSDDEVEQFRKILNACKSSGTKAVVFPAHNEGLAAAESAAVIDEEVVFLNWKGEIDSFIKTGMSKWDFCVQDGHSHSNSLAGYVGAHMIYRAIYGKCPDGRVSSSIGQSFVDKKLGDYSKTGIIKNLNIDNAIILK